MEEEMYNKLLNKRRKWYNDLKTVYCPCLGMDVIFNSQGFRHLRYDGRGKLRPLKDRMRRLQILPHVVKIIASAKSITSHRKYTKDEYWGISKKIGSARVTMSVILRKSGEGKVIYYSVM